METTVERCSYAVMTSDFPWRGIRKLSRKPILFEFPENVAKIQYCRNGETTFSLQSFVFWMSLYWMLWIKWFIKYCVSCWITTSQGQTVVGMFLVCLCKLIGYSVCSCNLYWFCCCKFSACMNSSVRSYRLPLIQTASILLFVYSYNAIIWHYPLFNFHPLCSVTVTLLPYS